MRLLHHSAKPIGELRVTAQNHDRFKPLGLWLSVDGDNSWAVWCGRESFGLGGFEYTYEVELAEDANILTLTSFDAIIAFHRRYHDPDHAEHWRALDLSDAVISAPLVWSRVAQDYDGVMIPDYQHEWNFQDRHMPIWHYGWDCSSGCIWQPRAIKAMRLLPETIRPVVEEDEDA